jgi:ribonuclease HIII
MREAKSHLHTCTLDEKQLEKLRIFCAKDGWESHNIVHSAFAYRGANVHLVAYRSGKVVITGRGTEDFIIFHLEPEITGQPTLGYEEVLHPEWFEEHGGMDESGKGDLFGPLVSACVIAGGETVRHWIREGVRDCKAIGNDQEIFHLDWLIRQAKDACVEVFSLGMRKYNELYGGFGSNLNRLLAWYHSKSLLNAVQRHPIQKVLLDQFSKQPLVQLYYKGPDLELTMRPRAEEDPVVAAASIAARAEFLRSMDNLSKDAGEKLLRGAGEGVLQQARELVRRLGITAFGNFAKLHFSTAQQALYG